MSLKPEEEQLLKRQRELQERLKRHEFLFLPIAEFLCRYHQVRDVWQIDPFPGRTHAWQVMRSVTLGIEVGSVSDSPHAFRFELEPEDSAEQQVYSCKFDKNLPWCRFLDSPIPKDPFKNPVTDQPIPVDLDKVCVYNFVTRHVLSNMDIHVEGRLNFYHKGVNEIMELEANDNLIANGGGIKGSFISIAATGREGEDVEVAPIPRHGFMCTNEHFTATMAMINDKNLMHGIVEIPPAVCQAAKLRIWTGPPEPPEAFLASALEQMTMKEGHVNKVLSEQEQSSARSYFANKFKENYMQSLGDRKTITHYYAIPIAHVLAWPFHSEEYANEHGYEYEQFRFIPPPESGLPQEPVISYFLVGNVYFDAMLAEFKRAWMNKVDMRPLSSMAYEFLPRLGRSRYPTIKHEATAVQGFVAARSYMTYMVPPKMMQATIDNLAPTLAPGFPSSYDWATDAIAKQMAIERHQERAVTKKE